MAQQILTGNAMDLGATAAGGTVTISPARYAQVIGGVIISSKSVTAVIDSITGNFSFSGDDSITQGAYVHVKAKDSLGKTFLDTSITVSNDATQDLSQYLQNQIPAAITPLIIDGNIHTIKLRRKQSTSWTMLNPVLGGGEEGIETDTGLKKVGDGITAWNDLQYEATGSGTTLTLADIIALELSACPRRDYQIWGNSTDGGTSPDATTQASINALLAAGVPASNIVWRYVVAPSSGTFRVSDLILTPAIDLITLFQNGSFSIGNMTAIPAIDNVSIVLAGGTLSIASITDQPVIDAITLYETGSFSIADLIVNSSIDNVSIIFAGGTFSISDLTVQSAVDNVTITAAEALDQQLWSASPISYSGVVKGQAAGYSASAHSFVPGVTGNLTKLVLALLHYSGATNNITVKILGSSGGAPNDSDVKATATITGFSTPNSTGSDATACANAKATPQTVTFSSPPSLTSGTTYFYSIEPNGSSSDLYCGVIDISVAGGYYKESYGGAWINGAGVGVKKMLYKTYMGT